MTYTIHEQLEQAFLACDACPLRQDAVGPSGQLLDKALASVGITRDKIYTTNVIPESPAVIARY